jgi:ribosomal protein L11 methyltransferase
VGGVETRDPTCIADGPDFVAVERPELIVYTTPSTREGVEQAARELVDAQGIELRFAATIEAADHQGDDWRDAWKRYYRPLLFGTGATRLLIRPSWIARTPDDPPLELVLDPGRAFGTGLHESTRLCLRALVGLADEVGFAPTRVLDLGCGSGILGLAAARLWPSVEQIVLADHDPEAVETAQENAALNGLTERVECRQLDLGPGVPLPASMQSADVVLANIRPSVLIPAAEVIMGMIGGGGASTNVLILSGILDEEGDAVRAAYASLALRDRPREADWCALVLGRS